MTKTKTSNKHKNQKISRESEEETNKSDHLEVMTSLLPHVKIPIYSTEKSE